MIPHAKEAIATKTVASNAAVLNSLVNATNKPKAPKTDNNELVMMLKEDNLKKCRPGKEDANFKPIIEYLDQHPNEDGSKVKVHM